MLVLVAVTTLGLLCSICLDISEALSTTYHTQDHDTFPAKSQTLDYILPQRTTLHSNSKELVDFTYDHVREVSSRHSFEQENSWSFLNTEDYIEEKIDLQFPKKCPKQRSKRDISLMYDNLNINARTSNHTLSFKLSRRADFISPSLIVQKGNFSWLDTGLIGNSSCFYTGHIDENYENVVVGSACNGLKGYIYYNGQDYFIKPVSSEIGPTSASTLGQEQTIQHTLYRRRRDTSKENLHSHNLELTTIPTKASHRTDQLLSAVESDAIDENNSRCATITSGKHAQEVFSTLLSDDTPPRSRRTKRSVSRDHTIELMIAADTEMNDYYGSGLESYVLSLVAVASRVYKDASLGNSVNIVLVKLHILESEQEGPNITTNAQQALKNFCEWQYAMNEADDDHPFHHDTAILLTRKEICRSKGKCGTLGLAELGTMCNLQRSCAIIEDNGLSSAFTIAHELGHVFGIPHDDSKACDTNEQIGDFVLRTPYTRLYPYNIMSSTLESKTKSWSWSECSRNYITKALDKEDQTICLRDTPTNPADYQLPSPGYQQKLTQYMAREPGERYEKDYQCAMVYGRGAKICSFMPVCTKLWCSLSDDSGCRTQHMPWADGTDCGDGKWCQRGQCVERISRGPQVHGGWNQWGQWSECSKTCGGGVRYHIRTCTNPEPQNGGQFCLGRRTEYESCNTDSCPESRSNFRDIQCSEYNHRDFQIPEVPSNVIWRAKYSEVTSEQCKLYCNVGGTDKYFLLSNQVIDGTKCTKDGTGICVQGVCEPAGCNNVLWSDTHVDQCGVCGGDNSSCHLEEITNAVYTSGMMQYGYHDVVRIPVNASNIMITQTSITGKTDANYLVVKTNEKYLFNGEYVVTIFGRIEKLGNGATIEYSGSEAVAEVITITGWISEELIIQVLSVGSLHAANIEYRYVIQQDSVITFSWMIGNSYTECSRPCSGRRNKELFCIKDQGRQRVPEEHCQDQPKPSANEERCNLHCAIRWQVVRLEDCSTKCSTGYISRNVTCIMQSAAGIEPVDDSLCTERRPSSIEACRGECSVLRWQYGPWGKCSADCGDGAQTRNATCIFGNRAVEPHICSSKELFTTQSCVLRPCSKYDVTQWSQCSATCGTGTQTRRVTCISSQGQALTDGQCDDPKPEEHQECQAGPCPDWFMSNWTDCSATCGSGLRFRKVKCARTIEEEGLDEQYCSTSVMPATFDKCEAGACPDWSLSDWTECSVTCGTGIRRRSVTCALEQERVSLDLCTLESKPQSIENCTRASCSDGLHRFFSPIGRGAIVNYQWRLGAWGECSVDCGTGSQERQVSCRRMDFDNQVHDSYCRDVVKPYNKQDCRLRACGTWKTGNYGQCIAQAGCGEGYTSRAVACALTSGVYGDESDCEALKKPEARKPCHVSDCPTRENSVTTRPLSSANSQAEVIPDDESLFWRVGGWTECSVSCGGGIKRRAVECYRGKQKSDECPLLTKREGEQRCNSEECPKWRTGGYTKCSAECGLGYKERMVICQLHDGTKATDGQVCAGKEPVTREDCFIKPCGTSIWNTTAWSECSISCGMGEMSRRVACVDSANRSLVLNNSWCNQAKPPSVESCLQTNCTKWHTGPWMGCSGTCENAKQTRSIWCSSLLDASILDSAACNASTQPIYEQPCQLEDCGPRWTPTEWSQCSSSCGPNVLRSRSAKCTDEKGVLLSFERCASFTVPPRHEPCDLPACPEWRTGNWSKCSVSCGNGQATRSIQCYNVTTEEPVAQALCDLDQYPVALTVCKNDACPVWVPQEWRKCSGECGAPNARQHRKVLCVTHDGETVLTPDQCMIADKPPDTRICMDCALWSENSWGPCSASCGEGIQQRRVTCVNGLGAAVPESECTGEPPRSILRCRGDAACSSWEISDWSTCSVTCGNGRRHRKVQCVDNSSKRAINPENCGRSARPLEHTTCTITSCTMWATSNWTPCSTTCGEGFRTRNVSCMHGESVVADDLCLARDRPNSRDTCTLSSCNLSVYVWLPTRWSECSASCGYGVRTRQSSCYSVLSQREVPLYFCSIRDRPRKLRRCQIRYCSLAWNTDEWSQCSTSCGAGQQFRQVTCNAISPEGWKTSKLDNMCTHLNKPNSSRSCDLGQCYASFVWISEKWEECDAPCGRGKQRRRVRCVKVDENGAHNRAPRENCDSLYKPARARSCDAGPCYSKSCAELRNNAGIRADGEYSLRIRDSFLRVYCHKMSSRLPEEYINLPSGPEKNLAIVSGHRLASPYSCPVIEGDQCPACVSETFSKAGTTAFSKIRINITTLTVITDDFQFASHRGNNKIPYGSAGDCFSTVMCPQGRFSINLERTGLRIAQNTRWIAGGKLSHQLVYTQKDNVEAQGRCGGYCGYCAPDPRVGLVLELDIK